MSTGTENPAEKLEQQTAEESVIKEEGETEKKGKKASLHERLAEAEAEVAALKDQLAQQDERYKRVLAEYDNFRKRSAKERESLYSEALGSAIASFLPVLDNMERAEALGSADEGLLLILKQLRDVLEKYNVQAFGAPGESFDPNIHNALLHVEDETLGEDVIAEVMEKGYRMGDRILRYAVVKSAN